MECELVIKSVLEGFEQRRIRYAVCGGFALGILGVPRATLDLDFLVHRDDLEPLHACLTSLGYARKGTTENVSQYIHREAIWGALDCLHAFRKYSLAMLERARPYPIFKGTHTVKVLEPEDVIGLLKVQEVANNPSRLTKDTVDIEALMEHYGAKLDWNRIQEFYDLF